MRRARALAKLTLLLGSALGCMTSPPGGEASGSGQSGSGAASSGGSSSVGGSATSGGSSAVGGATGVTTEACPTQELPPTPLRRLTRFEYENSVSDLLGIDAAAARDLPSDEVTGSFDNNAGVLTVSSLHAEKYVLVSEALAAQGVQNLAGIFSCDIATLGEEPCALEFARTFGRRAFRRALSAADEELLMAAYSAGRTGGSYQEGLEVMIRAALQSPHFLYRLELPNSSDVGDQLVPLSPFELATRLSYLIWASGPDDALLDAAEAGQLSTKEQVAAKAREMLSSAKARLSLSNFFNQWSGLSRLEITTKNTTLFPEFTSELRVAMARELPALLEHVVFNGDHLLGSLLTTSSAFVSGPLAALYGVASPAGSDTTPQPIDLPLEQGRAGLLTQAGFLSVQGHPDQTSPVLRGKFVRSMLLCDPPSSPPDNVDISLPEIDAGGTARERFAGHLSASAACSGCHELMDPIGLAFEHFDALGRYRETDGGQAIDVSGEVTGLDDPALAGPFVGVRELADKLAASERVQDCMATQMFRFASGRGESLEDSCSLGTLQEAFRNSGGDVLELLVSITQTDAFFYRSPVVRQ